MQRPREPGHSSAPSIDDLFDNLTLATSDPKFTHLNAILEQARRQTGRTYTRDNATDVAKLLIAICEAKGICPVSSARRMERKHSVKMAARIVRIEVERLAESSNS